MKTYIWTLPTRLFHWLLAISFAAAYLLGGEENYLSLHAALGSFIGSLILFRIIQGIAGPRYARFHDFPVSPAFIKLFITSMKKSKASHPGHNPLASVIMICIMITALISAVSGMLIFATGETEIFGIRFNPGVNGEVFEEFHEVVVNIFLVLVGIHLAGILADTFFHRENGTIFSIFTGYKNIEAKDAHLSSGQKIFSVFWFVIPAAIFFYVLLYQPLPAGENENTEQVEDTDKDED
jgi:cytochrome b